MKRILVVLAVLAGVTPAAADTCFQNQAGDQIAFLSDGENTVTMSDQTGCTWANSEVGPNIQCADISGAYWFASLSRDSNSRDILIFNSEAWYSGCDKSDSGI